MYPYGRTGIQILSLLTGTLLEQEGLDEIYARPGDTITVQIRIAAFKVGKGELTIDEAVSMYGVLE